MAKKKGLPKKKAAAKKSASKKKASTKKAAAKKPTSKAVPKKKAVRTRRLSATAGIGARTMWFLPDCNDCNHFSTYSWTTNRTAAEAARDAHGAATGHSVGMRQQSRP